jgi:hypothetical protein
MTTRETAEQVALQGLLLVVVEVQNLAREVYAAEPTEFDAKRIAGIEQILTLVDDPKTLELVQLARAALATPADVRKTFYGIVTERDINDAFLAKCGNGAPVRIDGPIIFEQYLNGRTADRAHVEDRARSMTGYGWVRVAEITVEIPLPTPAAIPAAVAGVHT